MFETGEMRFDKSNEVELRYGNQVGGSTSLPDEKGESYRKQASKQAHGCCKTTAKGVFRDNRFCPIGEGVAIDFGLSHAIRYDQRGSAGMPLLLDVEAHLNGESF